MNRRSWLRWQIRGTLYALGLSMIMAQGASAARADEPLIFISAFTAGENGAIHACRLNPETGALQLVQRTTDVEHPFFMALSPNRRFLYSIHARQFGGKDHEEVAAYQVGENGQLKLLNRQSALGSAACYLEVDATGRTVMVSNYTTGNVASFPVNEDGSLREAASSFQHAGSTSESEKPPAPHAHCIVVSPDNRYAYSADLGLNQVLIYRLDAAQGRLTKNDPPLARTPAGSGPRHLTFHPNGKRMYVINEYGNSVTVFDYDASNGGLTEIQTLSTLPADFDGKSYCADLKITPDGRYLYGTNRGHDSIAGYRIGDDGRLTLIGIEPSLGKGPQNLAITPDGRWLLCANMPGNNVVSFRIDGETGGLKSAGDPLEMPMPSCIMQTAK